MKGIILAFKRAIGTCLYLYMARARARAHTHDSSYNSGFIPPNLRRDSKGKVEREGTKGEQKETQSKEKANREKAGTEQRQR